MKREKIIWILLLVFSFPLASALLYEGNSPKFMVEKGDFETSEVSQASQEAYSVLADGELKVDVIWPLPGYYYVTDFLQIAVYTNKIANCTYDFSSSIHGMYENGTEHRDYIYGLEDNMEGEPYEILFECTDSISTGYNDTWFWINNTEYLGRYLLREGIGSYEYMGAELSWEGNDNGLLQVYGAVYKKNSTHAFVQFLVFDDPSSVSDFISNELMPNIEDNYSIIVVNRSNMYFVQEEEDKGYIWNSKNYIVSVWAYSTDNSSVSAPLETLNAYLGKYPGELRNGICGDGKTDVLNEEGFAEECDKNQIQRDCGSSVGECRKGKETRICNRNCTWGRWENCSAVMPKKETCDGKDNDCDGKADEDFPNLGKNCSAGTGACFREGSYVCSSDKLSTKCSITAGTPSKENCTDNMDNDCDGLKDFKDPECILFKLISPVNKSIYSQNKILFDILLGYEMDELGFSYFDDRGREKEARLCRECSSYTKNYTLRDGKYNINISAIDNGTIAESRQVFFIVDSTAPKISRTLPKKNSFTNGSFYMKYTEENLNEVLVTYNPTAIIRSCNKSGKDQECYFSVNLKAHDGKEIEYSVNMTDTARHTTESRPVKVKVDTTPPKINNPKSMVERTEGGYAYLKINITEINLDRVEYYDNNNSRAAWKKLCTRLEDGICEKKVRFIGEKVNMTIAVIDKAGNSQLAKIP